MIEITRWLFACLVLLAVGGCILIAAVVSMWCQDRPGPRSRDLRQREAYVDWCRRNRWCPEHNVPDGHSGIFPGPDGLLTVGPCPGSATRHAVPWAGSRVEMWRAIADEERRRG